MSVNKVILVGNVGKDPETRYLDENTAVCKFPLATSEVYKNREGERIEQTEWHNVVLWRGLAQVAEKYVKKGSQLYIEGRIRTRSWDDKEGNKRYTTEIVGDIMQMLGKKQDDNQSGGASYQGNTNTGKQQAAPAQSAQQSAQQSTQQSAQQQSASQSPDISGPENSDMENGEDDGLPF